MIPKTADENSLLLLISSSSIYLFQFSPYVTRKYLRVVAAVWNRCYCAAIIKLRLRYLLATYAAGLAWSRDLPFDTVSEVNSHRINRLYTTKGIYFQLCIVYLVLKFTLQLFDWGANFNIS